MRIAADKVVRPIIVEFVANTVVRDIAVEGVLKIASPRRAQEIYFHGVVAKNDAIEVDTTEEQTIPSGCHIEGRVINGKIVFVEDPAQFTREDDEVFLISKYELNIEEAPEVL